jgi:hypothetical protein
VEGKSEDDFIDDVTEEEELAAEARSKARDRARKRRARSGRQGQEVEADMTMQAPMEVLEEEEYYPAHDMSAF